MHSMLSTNPFYFGHQKLNVAIPPKRDYTRLGDNCTWQPSMVQRLANDYPRPEDNYVNREGTILGPKIIIPESKMIVGETYDLHSLLLTVISHKQTSDLHQT